MQASSMTIYSDDDIRGNDTIKIGNIYRTFQGDRMRIVSKDDFIKYVKDEGATDEHVETMLRMYDAPGVFWGIGPNHVGYPSFQTYDERGMVPGRDSIFALDTGWNKLEFIY